MLKEPPLLNTGEIQAAYMQMINMGQNAVWQLGEAVTPSQWRDVQLAKLVSTNNTLKESGDVS